MVYLIFGCLFAAGAVLSPLLFRLTYRKKSVKVVESREKLNVKEKEFSSITLQHAVTPKDDPENIIITDVIPVHEPDGAELKLKIDRTTGQPVKTPVKSFITVPVAMFLAALLCFGLYLLETFFKPSDYTGIINLDRGLLLKGSIGLFGVLFFLYMLKDLLYILSPNVVKVKGKYEGYMHTGNDHRLTAYYSLWYGEYRQFARCPGVPVKSAADMKEHTLFFHRLKGTVIRRTDIIRNTVLALLFAGALAACFYI